MDRRQFIRGMSAMLGAVVFGPALTACGSGEDPLSTVTEAGVAGDTTLAATELDALEIAGLKFMREEEKLAHDVYATLFNTWGAQIFLNIAASETEHTEAVLGQIELYGVEDPAAGNPVGVFEDTYLQALYNKLIEMGSVSLIEGLKSWRRCRTRSIWTTCAGSGSPTWTPTTSATFPVSSPGRPGRASSRTTSGWERWACSGCPRSALS